MKPKPPFSAAMTIGLLAAIVLTAWLDSCSLAARPAGTPFAVARRSAKDGPVHDEKKPVHAVEVVHAGSYPELHVDGEAFFLHAASFLYERVPRDLWAVSLDRHRELGINTIRLSIPWNWHEPHRGELDFDGRTNPRRDLRALLQMIAEKRFKLIVEAGGDLGPWWRNGGRPEWLASAESKGARGSAHGNEDLLPEEQGWLRALASVLVPYGPEKKVKVKLASDKRDRKEEEEVNGPLLMVQLAFARNTETGALNLAVWEETQRCFEGAGLRGVLYVSAQQVPSGVRAAGAAGPVGGFGEWFLTPHAESVEESPAEQLLSAADVTRLVAEVESLKMQTGFPPMLGAFQAGWYGPGDDARPPESADRNTLLASRLAIARGLAGLSYFPGQDSLPPAGYLIAGAGRYFRWDAALDVAGQRRPRARWVERNGNLLPLWGEFLGGAHLRADFAIVCPTGPGTSPNSRVESSRYIREAVEKLERLALLAGYSTERVNAGRQPLEVFERHAALVLPVVGQTELGDEQSDVEGLAMVEYVRHGGALILYPTRPSGRAFEPLWAAASAPGGGARQEDELQSWKFGEGQVIESSKELASWIALQDGLSENRMRFEAEWATTTLKKLLTRAGVRPAVRLPRGGNGNGELVFSELVSNAGTGKLGTRSTSADKGAAKQTERRGLLSVTNLAAEGNAEATLEILSPRAGVKGAERDYLPLTVTVPAHESLLLPLHFPLCSAAKSSEECDDEVVTAGAELIHVEREGKMLELTFCAPARATLRLRLARVPGRIEIEEVRQEAPWDENRREVEVPLTRGASPDFLRVVRVHLPYTPHVPEKPDPKKGRRHDYDFRVVDAVRLPLGEDASLPSEPPLVILPPGEDRRFLLELRNYDEMGRDLDARVEGPVQGATGRMLDGGELRQLPVNLRTGKSLTTSGNGMREAAGELLRSELQVWSGRDRRTSPILFAEVKEEGVTSYQFDFDRDGIEEWVMENTGLRLIVSSATGGSVVALVEKTGGQSLFTQMGALVDVVMPRTDSHAAELTAAGLAAAQNGAYAAEWQSEKQGRALRLRSPAAASGGARVEKVVRLAGADTLEVDYEVTLPVAGDDRMSLPPQKLKLVLHTLQSVPAWAQTGRTTEFCWEDPSPGEPSSNSKKCRGFEPGKGSFDVPEASRRLEVRTPGRFGLGVEWESGKMIVEMKRYSALLRLEFPPLTREGVASKNRIRFLTIPVE